MQREQRPQIWFRRTVLDEPPNRGGTTMTTFISPNLIGGLLVIIASHRATAAQLSPSQDFVCTQTVCICDGEDECKELIKSGFCVGSLLCGPAFGLRWYQCKCVWAKGTGPNVSNPPANTLQSNG